MLLDIIIPQYSENEETIKELLDSIKNQEKIDFNDINVTIVNDCSNVILSDEFLMNYEKLNICYIKNDRNTGPGLARQKGVDSTDNKYIMFCDADDRLANNISLFTIISFIKKYSPNYLVTNIEAEVFVNGKKSLLIKKARETFPWMHGKVYKRSFLEENDIKFSPNVRYVEDIYYTTCVVGSIDPRLIYYLDAPTYRWKDNSSSLTRKKEEFHYLVTIFDDFINCPLETYKFLTEKKSYLRFSFIVSAFFGIYIALYSNIFDDHRLQDRKNKYEVMLKDMVVKKRNIFYFFKEEELDNMFEHEKKDILTRNGIEKTYKTLDDFLNEYIKK